MSTKLDITTSSKLTLVTPEWAVQIIERHNRRLQEGLIQRPISESLIDKYAIQMTNNMWHPSPEPIAFDTNDDLIEGQHRLLAVIKSKRSIWMTISKGWPPKESGHVGLVDVINTGKSRTIGHMLHVDGVSNANAVASVIRNVIAVGNAGRAPAQVISVVYELFYSYNIKESLARIMATTTNPGKDMVGLYVGPIVYYHTSRPKKAADFAESYFSSAAEKGSAVQLFLSWLRRNSGANKETKLRAICHALRLWDGNDTRETLKPTVEAVEWLSNTNSKLREVIRKLAPRVK